ncbi:MAG TPA: N-acyl homoserine lactonase family protein [Rhizomicrobium sp.]
MAARLFAFACGAVTGARSGFLEGESGSITVPVPAYLVVHEQGRVLFDTGLHIAIAQDKHRLLGRDADNWQVDLPRGADIVSQLALLHLVPSDIRYVVNSHLHYDHCGGNNAFPDATMIVHAKEWRAAQRPNTQAAGIYNPAHYDRMAAMREIEGELDLFGDGTVVAFPTPGHTPGHQSLRVVTGGGPIVLAADCCYLKRTLDTLHLPGSVYNRDQMLESLHLLRRMQSEGARIFFGHDAQFWETVPQAPLPAG